MAELSESEMREEMLRKRGFYASRLIPGGPVKIREVLAGRVPSGYYVSRIIERIGGIDVSSLDNQQIYYYLTAEEPSSSANASAQPTYSAILLKKRTTVAAAMVSQRRTITIFNVRT